MAEFSSQTAIVTGGTRGIGRAIATALAEKGATVAILGTRPDTVARAADELAAATGASVTGWACDVSQAARTEEVFGEIAARLGKIDILVNNAGITRDNLLLRMTEQQWDDVIATDLKGVFNCCHAVSRHMLKARYGRIVNISSVVGLLGNAGQANYAAAKGGVIAFSKSLARELASRNILVNCLAPGFIETDMTAVLTRAQKDEAASHIPLGRIGTPGDIARAAIFLASPENTYITGQVLSVDGGMAM